MKPVIILAALCAALFTTNAEARPRHHHHHHHRHHHHHGHHHRSHAAAPQGVIGAFYRFFAPDTHSSNQTPRRASYGLRRVMSEGAGRVVALSRFIRGRLVCARNVDAALAARGIRGTGSALAKSYLHWGHASGPAPGAVAVFSRGGRGGHVALVDHVEPDGTVIYLNPSSRRQAWHVGPYNRKPIAYRIAATL